MLHLCVQVQALEQEMSQARTNNQKDRGNGDAAAVLGTPLWQQDQICLMQQQWIERLQKIKECCLPH